IHGATFSSAELSTESESLSGGAVQIGNAITEKMLTDVLLQSRDLKLFHAVTDCGAGGFSSAVGEMGAELGAEVWLDRAPLKYEGLSYTEIWISEAQERMVLAVPPSAWSDFLSLCQAEGVEATIVGQFQDSGELVLKYQDHEVGRLSMKYLHQGRPRVVRLARYLPRTLPPERAESTRARRFEPVDASGTTTLLKILASPNVASKETVIRQYDHEVQGGSVVKSLVGPGRDGPGDAAVIRPCLDRPEGIALACGINPRLGDLDPYAMAASAIDETVRNVVAVGADPDRIAILDNFCWGNTEQPETLGTLVRAALACHDIAIGLGTPFISGKDSLNNEFVYRDTMGAPVSIAIPPTLLISGLGYVPDTRQCVTMDFKEAGNLVYIVGQTHDEVGGSHWEWVTGRSGLGPPPKVIAGNARGTFRALHAAMRQGLVRACHDLSEGGLAVAVAEMAFAGGLGAVLDLSRVPTDIPSSPDREARIAFSESNSRFICEIAPPHRSTWESALRGVPWACVGSVTSEQRLVLGRGANRPSDAFVDVAIQDLKEAWQATFR
ncbi:MAG TPA: AIR synthase-related protein, partial [Pirellulaceae bacterium]